MMIAARNAMLMSGAKLPYDAEVDYLESTGTQWLNTGYYAGYNTAIDVECAWMRYTSDEAIISMDEGSAANKSCTVEYASTGNWGILLSFGSGDPAGGLIYCRSFIKPILAQKYIMSASKDGLTFGGNTYTRTPPPSDFSCAYPLLMFTYGRRGQAIANSAVRVYALTIRDGIVARDYIPVRVGSGSSAVGYLYDRANPTGGPLGNGLYPNAGTGAFVVGPDK